mgnify:CR=1 FL=1
MKISKKMKIPKNENIKKRKYQKMKISKNENIKK